MSGRPADLVSNIGDEFSSDEVTVYKEEGEAEGAQIAGENFGLDKVELIKEAEQVSTKPIDATGRKDSVLNAASHERTTPAVHRQFNSVGGSYFDGNGALSPSATGLFSASGPYAALLSASRLAGALSPVTLGLLAAASNSQPASSPGPLSADHMSALMAAGVASPPAQLAAAVAARSSPALAALQIAAALHPYSLNRSNAGSTTPSATPGVASSGEQFGAMVAAAGLQQLASAALAAAQSPPVWSGASNSNSTAASNWLYGAGHGPCLPTAPVGGGIVSPALAASPSASLLARLSPALSTLSCLAAAANAPPAAHHHSAASTAASFLLNAAATAAAGQNNVPSPSSVASSVSNHYAPPPSIPSTTSDNSASNAVEVMLLRAAMMQQQQNQAQQQQQQQQLLDVAQQLAFVNAANAAGNNSPNVPLTPRSKQLTLPTPTSRPRPVDHTQSSPLALNNSLKRPHNSLAHQTTRPVVNQQHSPMMPMPLLAQHQQQPVFPGHPAQSPAHHHSAFAALDPHRQAHLMQQHQEQFQQHTGHSGGHQGHHHRNRTPPNEPHVKKPLNAFMLFMKEQRAQVIAECTLKESAAINQILGQRWHNLSRDEQARYYDLAKAEKERHAQLYPNWSARENYASHSKKKRRRKMGAGGIQGYPGVPGGPLGVPGMGPEGSLKDSRDNALKKCRARYGVDQMDKWCKPCRRKKKCARYYNLPGADDDNDGGSIDVKGTPSSHHTLVPGMMAGMNNSSAMTGGVPGLNVMGQFAAGGGGMSHDDDDWGSDSASSVGDSVGDDDDDDEEQLNAFHLVSESSSASSTPSPTPAVLPPLSPTSSIHSSASHNRQHHLVPGGYIGLPLEAMVKMAPSTPESVYPPILGQQQQQLNVPQSQQQFINDANIGPQSSSSGGGVPSVPGTSSSASSEVPPPLQLPSTPPSTTSASAAPQQHLCSPSSTSTGIAFRPLLPAN